VHYELTPNFMDPMSLAGLSTFICFVTLIGGLESCEEETSYAQVHHVKTRNAKKLPKRNARLGFSAASESVIQISIGEEVVPKVI
jgi:hypothetical protein